MSKAATKNLVIVESPAKAATIERYLGPDYTVIASYGHVRDLPQKSRRAAKGSVAAKRPKRKKGDPPAPKVAKGLGSLAVDVENGFTPRYEIIEEKEGRLADIRRAAKGAEAVWLATDLDREGDAIAWHLAEALEIPEADRRRVTFSEITTLISSMPNRRVASLIASSATNSRHSSRAWLHRAPLLGACSRLPFALWWSVSARFVPSSHGTTAPLSWAFAQLRTQIWLSLRALLGRRGRTSRWSLRLPKPPLRVLLAEWQSSRSATRARESSGPFRRSPPQHCSRRRDASMATVHASRCSSRRSFMKALTLVVSAPV